MKSERGRPSQAPILRSIRRYVGPAHPWAIDQRVVIVSVLRGGEDGKVIDEGASIGSLRADDRIEFAPIAHEANGAVRTSWVTSDASPDGLGPAEGVFSGPMPDGLLLHVLPPVERN